MNRIGQVQSLYDWILPRRFMIGADDETKEGRVIGIRAIIFFMGKVCGGIPHSECPSLEMSGYLSPVEEHFDPLSGYQ